MNLKNRLAKLEHKANPVVAPLVLIQSTDNGWTPEQFREMKEAKAQGRMILRVEFLKPKKRDGD